ncbi:hypothetical protein [Leptolyngbya sp. 7M]|uniref:hypothetical protein n=1 Tax=Leptolyngbya sp. 7M TaxID=2812896 RepID=UPI001B8B3FF1|nr:hypothetical protein [Leptolyngbya sp. 7M]QYO65521.1 hypothetical protein JVX88_01670 [Leptolyngbya sp. 7M]
MKHLKNFLLIPMLLAAIFSVSAVAQDNSEEVRLANRLIEALERENAALRHRLDTEKAANAVLIELNQTRKSETDALREALRAKNETIAAKDAAIAAQEKLIAELRTKRTSIWRRIGDVAAGIALGALLK